MPEDKPEEIQQQHPEAEDVIEEESDYDKYEREDQEPILNTEFEHKFELARPKVNRRMIDAASMLDKELRLSRVDTDQAFIFPLYLEAANAFRKLGFQEVADDLNAYVKIKLSILASVNGFERNRQTYAASSEGPVPMMPTFNEIDEEEARNNKKPSFIDKLMRR